MASRMLSRSASSASVPLDASSTKEAPALDAATAEKTVQIMAACHDRRLSSLADLATSTRGLVSDTLRRTAWPILLGCADGSSGDPKSHPPWGTLAPHRDEEQVAKDVNRAFVHYPRESDRQLDKRREELSSVIVEVLRRHPALCYFQGYHDIVQVLYLVLGAQDAAPAVTRLSLLRIRDYMLPTLEPALRHLELLPAIIRAEDPILYDHLPTIQPNYALGATLTLFSHVIESYGDITRLFDFFLATDTVIPVYLFAVMVMSRRDELMELDKDEDEAIFHVTLGKLPQPFDLEARIAQTLKLYEKLPPQSLRWPWWKISASSALKATSTPLSVSSTSLDVAQALFQKQEREVQLKMAYEKMVFTMRRFKLHAYRYRRPGTYGLAIAVGVYALWVGRNGNMNYGRFMTIGAFSDALRSFFNFFV
ncbi:hypothetical protein K491DRAFT_455047 [Lophiostoma macrostomum CBS 122681]|uniref:Rab-GAP TBC domain-containing protein n=1 Tax=Lophiostoma macrostomum CBS 122681 TaxID=1314788 RepID=A0A6A6T7G2_9PLEO|nr:hypothetical protein K491DRAFT_455047 [Lophiostoma macrostomum CBS 122681]